VSAFRERLTHGGEMLDAATEGTASDMGQKLRGMLPVLGKTTDALKQADAVGTTYAAVFTALHAAAIHLEAAGAFHEAGQRMLDDFGNMAPNLGIIIEMYAQSIGTTTE